MFLGHNYQKYPTRIYLPKVMRSLYISLRDSARLDNEEIFRKLTLFIRAKISDTRNNGSLSAFKELIIVSSNIYPNIGQKYRSQLIDLLAINFRENSTSAVIIIRNEKISLEKIKKQRDFAELNYWATVQLIKRIIDVKDFANFTKIFDEINQIESWFELRESETIEQKKMIEDIRLMHHSVYVIIYSWLMFSYSNKKITIEELNNFNVETNILDEFHLYDDIELFELFIELKERVFHHFLEIDNWELEEHKPGKAYIVLSSRQWLNFGFSIMLLNSRSLIFSRFGKEIRPNESHTFLINDIKPNIEVVEKNFVEMWSPILYKGKNIEQALEELSENKKNIIIFLQELKKKQELNKYKEITEEPISTKKVEEFKANVLRNWKNNNVIPEILKQYNAVKYLPNVEEKKGMGYFNLYSKMKSIFTEKNNMSVYGVSDVGARLARDIEKQFYLILKEHKGLTEVKDLKNKVDEFISKTNNPSKYVIFTDWKGLDLLNKDGEVEYLQKSENKFTYAKYKGITVLNKSLIFPNTLLIIDIESSLEYTIYQDEKWFDKELIIEVKELTRDLIKYEISKYEEKWKYNNEYEVSIEEAELLIKSSILIKVLFKSEMKVIDTTFYEFFNY